MKNGQKGNGERVSDLFGDCVNYAKSFGAPLLTQSVPCFTQNLRAAEKRIEIYRWEQSTNHRDIAVRTSVTSPFKSVRSKKGLNQRADHDTFMSLNFAKTGW